MSGSFFASCLAICAGVSTHGNTLAAAPLLPEQTAPGTPRNRAMAVKLGAHGPVAAAALLALGLPAVWAAGGSASPTRARPGAPFEPLSASFVSARDGFVLGATPCARALCTALVATTDGAHRWSAAAAPPAPLATPPAGGAAVPGDAIGTILFTGTSGYAYGPGLWADRSARGAPRWVRLHPGRPVLDLAVSAGTVWTVVASCWAQDPRCASPTLGLERAPVGTDAWRAVPGIGGVSAGQLLFRGREGWVTLRPRRVPSPVAIWHTADAGASWSRIRDPCYRPAEGTDLAELAAPGSSTLVELCAGSPGAGQEDKAILESTDGGASARAVGNAPLGGLVDAFVAPSRSLLVLAASSGAGFLYRSADAGRHWRATTLDDGGAGLSGLAFASATVGSVVEGRPSNAPFPDRLLVTRDGALTWSAVPIVEGTSSPASRRIGPSAVWRRAGTGGQVGVFEACASASRASRGAVEACAARYMTSHGASAAAVAFFEATGSYLIRFIDTGRVDVGYTLSELPMDCGCLGWLLLNGRPTESRPPMPSLATTAYAPLQRAYRLAGRYGAGFRPLFLLYPPDLEAARELPGGGEDLWVQFPVNDACNACGTPYRARALYRLSPAGAVAGVVSLGPCRATTPAGGAPTVVVLEEPDCPRVVAIP
ncbi:MAG: hypothetical protein M0Z33_10320 [Actinomycetota bacterium]|nr:hypothetical protein [Actinomycetota bacterium]